MSSVIDKRYEQKFRAAVSIVRSSNVLNGYNLKVTPKGVITTNGGKRVRNLKGDRLTKREREHEIREARERKFAPQMMGDVVKKLCDFVNMPGAFDTFGGSLNDFNDIVRENLPTAFNASSEITEKLGNIEKNIKNLSENGVKHDVMHSIKNISFSTFSTLLSSKLFFALTLGAVYLLFGPEKTTLCMLLLAAIYGIKQGWVMELTTELISFLTPGVAPQSFEGTIAQRVIIRIWEYFAPEKDMEFVVPEMLTESHVTQSDQSKGVIISRYFEYVKALLRCIRKWLPGYSRLILLFEPYPSSLGLLEEVDSLVKAYREKKISVSDADGRAKALRTRVEDELRAHAGEAAYANMSRSLVAAKKRCEHLMAEAILLGAGRDVTRVPPAAFLLIGAPGVGKSYVLDQISTAVLVFLNRADPAMARQAIINKSQHIYSRNFADKFWEGYNNQPIVYLDEVGQSRSGPSVPKSEDEYVDLINLVNDKPFPLNMAQLEKKGTVFFDSKLIVGTTNISHFKIESINSPAAYDRRWRKFRCRIIDECSHDPAGTGARLFSREKAEEHYSGLGYSCREIERKIATSDFLRFQEQASLLDAPRFIGEELHTEQFISEILADVQAYDDKVASKQGARDNTYSFWAEKFFGGDIQPLTTEVRSYPDYVMRLWDDFKAKCFCTAKPQEDVSGDEPSGPRYTEGSLYDYIMMPGGLTKFLWWSQGQCFATRALGSVAHMVDRIDKRIKKLLVGAATAATLFYIGKQIYSYFFGEKVEPQLKLVDNVRQLHSKILRRSVVRFASRNSGGQLQHRGFGLCLVDRMVCVPRHYIASWRSKLEKDPNFEVYFSLLNRDQTPYQFPMKIRSLLDEGVYSGPGRSDLSILYLSTYPVLFPDITGCFADAKKGTSAVFPKMNYDDPCIFGFVQADVERVSCTHSYELAGESFRTDDTIVYSYATRVGDCGLPVLASSRFSNGRVVLGMHVAGNGTSGVGAPIHMGLIEAAVRFYKDRGEFPQVQICAEDHPIFTNCDGEGFAGLEEVGNSVCPADKVVYGKLPPPHPPSTTNIRPSSLYGHVGFEPQTCPAFLRPFRDKEGVHIDPIGLSTNKYSNNNVLDEEVLADCVNEYTDYVCNMPGQLIEPQMHRRVLSYREAVAGIPGVDGFDGIPRQTSAGYPYCLLLEKRGKESLWGEEGDYDFSSEDNAFLEKRCSDVIEAAAKGDRSMHVFYDFPKDERRPIAKVWAGKTRKISACPVDLAICVRMYFGAFIQWFIRNRIRNGAAVGINVYSKEVDALVDHLSLVQNERETRPRVVAGDFGNFDGSLPRGLIEAFTVTVDGYYRDKGSEASLVRWTLMQELANSRHILPNGVVYEWNGSNASGNPLTTILNSWCNNVLLRYAMCMIMHPVEGGYSYLRKNREWYKIVTYGDDNLIAVNPKKMPLITQSNLTFVLAVAGFEYTDENKEFNVSDDRTIDDVSFLKRRFEKNSIDPAYIFLAPLSLSTILESIQWTKRKDEEEFSVRDNVHKMLCELALHSRSVFDEHAPVIIAAAQEHLNYTPFPNTYEECQRTMMCAQAKW